MKRNFVSLGAISEIMGGYAFKSSMMSNEPKEFQIIKMSNLYKGSLDLNRKPSFWKKTDKKTERYLLQSNDILMTLTGTVGKRDYGYTVQIKNEVNLLLNQRVCRIRPIPKKIDGFYLFQYLRSREFLNKFFDCSIGGTGNQSNVGISDLRELDVYIPSLPEQKAIADLLSTWDEAIEKTELLIQAKEKRFKWLLRILMNPNDECSVMNDELAATPNDECQMMNAEFEGNHNSALITHNSPKALAKGGWKKVKLGELFGKEVIIEKGKSLTKKTMMKGNIPVVAGGQSYAYFTNSPTHKIPTVTISASGAYAGFIWFHDYPIWASDCNVLYALKGTTKFLYFALKVIQHRVYALQSGGAQPHVYSKDMKNLLIVWPSEKQQKQIAETLSTAQQEIDLLKQLAEKYKTQKRGLMQKMLTGIWRMAPDAVMRYEL